MKTNKKCLVFYTFLLVLSTIWGVSAQVLVKDIREGFANADIRNITTFQNKVYFSALDGNTGGLFVSDGTHKGTKKIKDGFYFDDDAKCLATSTTLYFTSFEGNFTRLWKSDGTEGGTQLVKTFNANTDITVMQDIYSVGNTVYLSLFVRDVGHELWKSDGTEGGTVKIRNFYQPNAGNAINWRELSFLADINSTLFFMANDAVNGLELWRTNGTDATTRMVKNINSDPNTDSGNALAVLMKENRSFTVANNKLYFAASDTSDLDDGIWSTDGTEAGTTKIKGFQDEVPNNFVKIGTSIYFIQFLSDVYRLNTTLDTIGLIGNTGSSIFSLSTLFAHQNELYFTVGVLAGPDLSELYRWNHTVDTAVFVRSFHSFAEAPLSIGNKLYLVARDTNVDDRTHYVWVSDGTKIGTKKAFDPVFSINATAGFSYNGTFLMLAKDEFHGEELWKYNPLDSALWAKPKYTSLQNNFEMAFINQSSKILASKWWSSRLQIRGDTTENIVKTLGEYPSQVVLEGINDYGSTFFSDTVTLRTGTFDIMPKIVGNNGYLTCEINGVNLNRASQFYFVKNGQRDIKPDSLIFLSSTAIVALFKFDNVPIGKRAIVGITNRDTVWLKDSFDIQTSDKETILEVSIIGPKEFRNGRKGYFQAFVSNLSNIDAFRVPLVISGIPNTPNWSVSVGAPIDSVFGERSLDSIYQKHKLELDSIFRKGTTVSVDSSEQLVQVILLKVPANSSVAIPFYLLFSNSLETTEIELEATVFTPLVDNDSTIYRSSGFWEQCFQPLLKCAATAADLAELIPGVGCAKEVNKLLIKAQIWDIGAKNYNSPPKMLDAGLDIATTAVKCALNFSPVDKISKVAKYAKKALDYVGNIKKADDCNTGANALLAVFKGGCPPPDPKKRNPRRDDGGGGGKGRLKTGTGASADPNSKSGDGVGILNAVEKGKTLNYQIHFENLITAAFPAEEVRILDTLDRNKFDMNTLQFTGVSFGDSIWTINAQPTFFQLIDMRPRKNFIVSITGSLDKETGILRCDFNTLNPSNLLPLNTLDGFLPPNRQAPEGEGWISYRIQQKATVKNNDTIRNRAAIYFDANPPIFTDYWTNRIDDEQPNSRVNANSVRINDTTVNLTITGTDNLSGIRYHAIYLSINDSAYTRWKIITEPTLRFTGKIGKKYKFYSIAVDGVGYIEDAPLNPIANPDAVIQLTTDVFDIPTEGVKIAAYPNPTAAELSIDFDVQKPCALTWQIIDPLGRLVYQKKYEKPTIGLFQDSWQTQSMPKGLYLLHVLIDNKSFSKKIVLN